MIQRNYTSAHEKKPPQKFIPRRDLFPDAEYPPPDRTASKPETSSGRRSPDRNPSGNAAAKSQESRTQQAQSIHTSRIPEKKAQPLPLHQPLQPVKQKSPLSVSPTLLFFLLAGCFLLWPKRKEARSKTAAGIRSAFENILDNPQSIQMLRAIGPYLEDGERDMILTTTGILEAASTLRAVGNHTYHDRNRSTLQYVPSDPTEKRIEILKTIRPYVPQDGRRKLEQVIEAADTFDQLSHNIESFRNNPSFGGDKKVPPMETVGELFRILRPVLPPEYRETGDKAMQVLKMAEVMGTAEQADRNGKEEEKAPQKKVRNAGQEQAGKTAEESAIPADSLQKMMDSLLPMLTDEQKGSVNTMLEMAQLLAQPANPSDSDASSDAGKEE